MKERKFLKWIGTWAIGILVVYLIVNVVFYFTLDNKLEIHIPDTQNIGKNVEVQIGAPDLISVSSIEKVDQEIIVTIEPLKKESSLITLDIINPKNQKNLHSTTLRLSQDGLLTDLCNDDFSHYRLREFCMALLLIAYTILLLAGYFKSQRDLTFSYHSIFCIGNGMWVAMIAIIISIGFSQNWSMVTMYGILSSAPMIFVILTFPAVLLFSIFLSISNVRLITREGFRFQNALGILLSFFMIFGFCFILFVDYTFSSGTEFQMDIINSLLGVLYSMYAILECFLIGSIICCLKAGLRTPAYDKDYIVILGCMIAPDGSLYPLIRQRVDKAIQFYKNQLKETGKKAIFIPSGGKGEDEPIAEGLAMRQYLIEQGIESEQIIVEDQSVNTKENMLFSKKLMKENSNAVFSTTNYHVFRSGIISRQVGIEIDGMGSKTKWYFWPNANVREVIGMLTYKWKALVLILIPVVAFITIIHFAF